MKIYSSCIACVNACMQSQRFAVSHQNHLVKTMSVHLHDCYEIYYCISGCKQFFLGGRYFDVHPGDAFLIPFNTNHHLTHIQQEVHERIVIAIHPALLAKLSTSETNLAACFEGCESSPVVHLDPSKQQMLLFCDRLALINGYGQDVAENMILAELMILLNALWMKQRQSRTDPCMSTDDRFGADATTAQRVIEYINLHVNQRLSLDTLAEELFISKSYLCRVFKAYTGTTIRDYHCARRISIAKQLLSNGKKPGEVSEALGFSSYSTFFKMFSIYADASPQEYYRFVYKQ